MKKINRALCLVLALAMSLALAACGEAAPKEVDIDKLAGDIVAAGGFGEELAQVDSSVAAGLYSAPEGTKAVAYVGSGSTAEEVAVFECSSDENADMLMDTLESRNQTRAEQYAAYDPEEVPKIENAFILSSGRYVVLIVSQDGSAAEKVAEDALK